MPFSTGFGTGTGIFLTRSQGRVADGRRGGVRRCCDGRAPSAVLCGGFVSVGVVFFLFWFSGLWVVVVLPLWGLVVLSACLVGWG